MSTVEDSILKAIEAATEKVAASKTPEEASQWQGIANQQASLLSQLQAEEAQPEPDKVDLKE